MFRKTAAISLVLMSTLTHSVRADAEPGPAEQCRFISLRQFADFTSTVSTNANEAVLLSPVIKAPIAWDQLVVSWDSEAAPDAWLKIEARGIYPDHETKYYTMGIWSKDSADHPRTSVRDQKDGDGTVKEDTLVLNRPGPDLQLRVTLCALDGKARPSLKFLGLSFCDTHLQPAPLPPNRAAWGKIIDTPELSQFPYPGSSGWCSPTSLTMVLRRWSNVLHRTDMNVDVPEVVDGIYDEAYGGTGNWPFNTAYAGSFPGMRAYVARFSDISELEDWIVAGIPVIISARWDWLLPGRPYDAEGHLTVCIGFTESGDLVINDPAAHFDRGQKVRHIYKRQDVIKAWSSSHNTVYLVYPETAKIPVDRFGHWDKP